MTYQGDTLSSSKSDIELSWQRLLQKSWSAGVAVGATQNTELGTKLRLNLSLVGLKDISYNNWNRLYIGTGLTLARETPYDDSGITNDLAGIVQVAWKVYKYTSPKIWVNSNIDYIPYLTSNRHRVSFNLNPQVSLFSDDFKVGISLCKKHYHFIKYLKMNFPSYPSDQKQLASVRLGSANMARSRPLARCFLVFRMFRFSDAR